MTYPWEKPLYGTEIPTALTRTLADTIQPVYSRPELVKDPVTGLYPGERDGIPGFLRRNRSTENVDCN